MAEGIQAAGQLIGGIASYETGKYNRALSRTEATEAERAGAAEATRVREAARMAIGEQLAAQGSNGFQQGTGSAIDARMQSQINAAMDALTVRHSAAARARAARVQGDLAYSAGVNNMVGSFFGAASSVASMKSDWASARSGSTRQPGKAGGTG